MACIMQASLQSVDVKRVDVYIRLNWQCFRQPYAYILKDHSYLSSSDTRMREYLFFTKSCYLVMNHNIKLCIPGQGVSSSVLLLNGGE